MRRTILHRRFAEASRQRALIRALSASGGRLTILEAARATQLTTRDCEDVLDDLARKGWLEIDESGGRAVYRVV